MRWEQLFADLEGQLAADLEAAGEAELAERIRHETGLHPLVDRLRAALGGPVILGLAPSLTLQGQLRETGPDWLLLADGPGEETLVSLAALLWVEGLPSQLLPGPAGRAWAGLDLRRALRALVRERAVVRVHLREGQPLSGTFDRVFADHLDLALHAPDEARRPGAVTAIRSVPVGAVAAVRRLG